MGLPNTLFTRDNIDVLPGIDSNSVDLIYLDPPFNSKRLYSAPIGSRAAGSSFKDMWSWQDVDDERLEVLAEHYPALVSFIEGIHGLNGPSMMAYTTYMAQRFIELRRILKPTGTVYLHCDPTASHYLKCLMDAIFGAGNARNEIVWHYDGPQSPGKKDFATKHDVILRYGKSDKLFVSKDDMYHLSLVEEPELSTRYRKDEQGRWFYDLPRGDYTDDSIERLKHEGRIRWTRNGNPRVKYFLESTPDGVRRRKKLSDVWNDIPSLGLTGGAKENTGYPTQKPLKLLHRILKASTRKGDMVLDPFCGCATTCVAAQQLGRKWIGIDIEEKAAKLVVERLSDDAGIFRDFVHRKDIPVRSDVQQVTPSAGVKESLFQKQKGICNGCMTDMRIVDLEIDHIVPRSKGGGDYLENYQLLCANCNRIKGNRPMEYLRVKIRKRREAVASLTFGE